MRRLIGVPLILVALAGCAPLERLGAPGGMAVDPGETAVFIDRLATAPPARLATLPASEPAPPERPREALRHALWLATPGHPGHDPDAAEAALRRLLAGDGLSDEAGALVRMQLRYLRERQARAAQNERLRRENERLREQIRELTALERRMGADEPGDTEAPQGKE